VGVTQQYISKIVQEKNEEKEKRLKQKSTTGCRSNGSGAAKNVDSGAIGHPVSQDKVKSDVSENEPTKTLFDTQGKAVPEHLREVFARANELKILIHQITQIVHQVKDSKSKNDVLYHYIHLQNVEVEAGNLKRALKAGLPHAVCCYCGGDGGKCKICEGKGWINELRFKATAEELKK
jgi:hypothetical protein